MIIAIMLAIGALAIAGAVALGLRNWLLEEGRTADEIRSHEASDLVYLVPPGQDPAVLVAALHHAGYAATTERSGGQSLLLVECPAGRETDRDPVRDVIGDVQLVGSDDVALPGQRVHFQDEL